jgi:hypothetical protein
MAKVGGGCYLSGGVAQARAREGWPAGRGMGEMCCSEGDLSRANAAILDEEEFLLQNRV